MIEYRKFLSTDVNQIVDILNKLYKGEFYRVITNEFFTKKIINNPLFNPNECFVALKSEQIVGFGLHIKGTDNTGWISFLEVIPEYQGKGIGTKLLKRIEQYAKELKEKVICVGGWKSPVHLYLGIERDRKKSIEFFKNRGYKVDPDYVGEGIYVLNLKDYKIPEKYILRKKELEKEGYHFRSVKNDKRIRNLCERLGREEWLESYKSNCVLCEKQIVIVGFCTFVTEDSERLGYGKEYEWGPFLVDPEEQGKGIGSVIITESLKKMSDMGCPHTWLQTGGRDSKASGPRIYRKLGFRLSKDWGSCSKELTRKGF